MQVRRRFANCFRTVLLCVLAESAIQIQRREDRVGFRKLSPGLESQKRGLFSVSRLIRETHEYSIGCLLVIRAGRWNRLDD